MRYLWVTVSAAVGAALMYILDPKGGKERREVILTQTNDALNKTNQVLNETTRDVNARTSQFVGTAREMVQQKAQEIRAQMQDAAEKVQESTQQVTGQAKRMRVNIEDTVQESAENAQAMLQGDKLLTDDELLARVRMVLDNVSTNSRAIKIDVNEGYVVLNGPIEENQMQGVLNAIASLDGIKGIENHMHPPTFDMTEEERIPGGATGTLGTS